MSVDSTDSLCPFGLRRDDQLYASCYCEENVYKLCQRLLDCDAQRQQRRARKNAEEQQQQQEEAEDAAGPLDVFVVFLSNSHERLLLFEQRAGDATRGGQIVWDYHVIAVTAQRRRHDSSPAASLSTAAALPLPPFLLLSCLPDRSLVYDFDSRLIFPSSFSSYATLSLVPALALPPSLHRLFRVVPAAVFLSSFASDRSHMIDARGRWKAAPPPWSCIRGEKGETMNLDSWRLMREKDVWRGDGLDADSEYGAVLSQQQFMLAFSPPTAVSDAEQR